MRALSRARSVALAACFTLSISVYRPASRSEHVVFTSSYPFSLIFITVVDVVIKVLALSSSTAVSLGADEQESHPTSPSSDSLCPSSQFTASGTALGVHERVHPSTSEHTCKQPCCAWAFRTSRYSLHLCNPRFVGTYKACSVRYRVL